MKWLGRFLLIVVVLAGSAWLAWHWMRPEQQRFVKDKVKTLIGRKPVQVGGPVPSKASVIQGKLATGDEAPFSLASGPWSLVEFQKDGKHIRPNLQFDFERSPDEDTSRLSQQWAHSGSFSYHMDAGTEYSPAVRRQVMDVANRLSTIDIGFWARAAEEGTKLTAVVSIERDDKQVAWFGKDLAATTDSAGSRLNARFWVTDQQLEPADVVSIYFWKRGRAVVYVDDLDIFFHSSEVLGRTMGQPVALDSIGMGGPHFLGYAQATMNDLPVDTTRFRAGNEAVPTTTAAVPIGITGKQWKFIPQEGLAYLLDASGNAIALIRPRSVTTGVDITHFDRVIAEPWGPGIALTGFDVDMIDGTGKIAEHPAPVSVWVQLQDSE